MGFKNKNKNKNNTNDHGGSKLHNQNKQIKQSNSNTRLNQMRLSSKSVVKLETNSKKEAKTRMSSGLLGMKFMSRKQDELDLKRKEKERRRKSAEERWVIDP